MNPEEDEPNMLHNMNHMDLPPAPSGEISGTPEPFDAEAEGETSGIFTTTAAAGGEGSGTETGGANTSKGVDDARLSPPTTNSNGSSNGSGHEEEESDGDASFHLLDEDNHTASETLAEAAAEFKAEVEETKREEEKADYTTDAGARAAVFNLVSANQETQQVQQIQGQTQGQPARVSELTNSTTSAISAAASASSQFGNSRTSVTESILAGIHSNTNVGNAHPNSSSFDNASSGRRTHRPSFHDSIGSLGMSTLDLQTRLGGPPTPELPGTASLSELPDSMMMTMGGGDDHHRGTMGSGGQGTSKRQRIDYDNNGDGGNEGGSSSGMSRSLPNLTGFESTSNKKPSRKSTGTRHPPTSPSDLIRTPQPSDVLFGRGGGTNVHVGNKIFRDLINAHRRSYLKARKNDKPHITQQILNEIHDRHGGQFLKKAPANSGKGKKKVKEVVDAEESDVHDSLVGTGWYEVDDTTAKEKISQALRQRAPELKKLIFKDQFGNEEIDYGQGNVVPVIFHPNPAENAYLRSLSVGLFSGGTEQVGQSHHAIEEAAKRRRMDQQDGSAEVQAQSLTPMPSAEQQQMLAQMQQVQMHLDQTAAVGQQQGLMAGDVFTAPLNDTVAVTAQHQQKQLPTFAAPLNDARASGDSSNSTPMPANAAAPTIPAQANNTNPIAASLVQGLGAAAFEPIPYRGIDFAMLTQEQERKIKLIEIQRLRLQKQQLELQIAQQKQMNKAGLAPMPAALDVFGAGGFLPTAGGGEGLSFPTGEMMAMGDAQLAQHEAEGATPPSSLLSAMANSQSKLSGSNGGSPPMALAPADGTGGTTPQYNPFGGKQA